MLKHFIKFSVTFLTPLYLL